MRFLDRFWMWWHSMDRISAKREKALDDLVRVQGQRGNWDCNDYMHGMANGLILAQHTISGSEGVPAFKTKRAYPSIETP